MVGKCRRGQDRNRQGEERGLLVTFDFADDMMRFGLRRGAFRLEFRLEMAESVSISLIVW